MGKYSIKDLERLSGIKAGTIRMWEQRYNLLEPNRTETNIRYYSDDQLKHLLNISLLVQHGFRISKISNLSEREFKEEVSSIYNSPAEELAGQEDLARINGLIVSMLELDEPKFNNIFASGLLKLGFEKNLYQIIFPFLEKVGLLWGLGRANPAQEHFISNLIRQKMVTAIDGLEPPPADSHCFVLFLREGELHEVGLLLASYLLQYHGHKVVYLGQNVPLVDLEEVVDFINPTGLLTFFTIQFSTKERTNYLKLLKKKFEHRLLLLAGKLQPEDMPGPEESAHYFITPKDLVEFVNGL